MAFVVHEKGPLLRSVQVIVTGKEMNAEESKGYSELRKTSRIPGFRPGKISRSVLRQRYGARIRHDAILSLAQKNLQKIRTEIPGIIHFSPWEMLEAKTTDNGFKFEIDVEVAPEVTLSEYKGLEVERPQAKITDEDVEKQLLSIQEEQATYEPVEDRDVIEKGDFVTVDIEGLGEAEEIKAMDQLVEIGSEGSLPGVEEGLNGASTGTPVEISTTLPGNFPEHLANKEVTLRLSPRSIKRKVIALLDDELALGTNREAETLEALREEIRTELVGAKDAESDAILKENITNALLDSHSIDLPEIFIKSRAQSQAKQQLQLPQDQAPNPEFLKIIDIFSEQLRPAIAKSVHTEFILDAIAKAEELEVSSDEIRESLKKKTVLYNVSLSRLQQIYSSGNMREQLENEILHEKVSALLLEHAVVSDIDWPSAEETPEVEAPEVEATQDETPETTA